jgi:hypothetical protein
LRHRRLRTGRRPVRPADVALARRGWYEANFTDPGSVEPIVYDRTINPKAAAWFKPSASVPLERVDGYLKFVADHGIGRDSSDRQSQAASSTSRQIEPGGFGFVDVEPGGALIASDQ